MSKPYSYESLPKVLTLFLIFFPNATFGIFEIPILHLVKKQSQAIC